MNSLHDDVTLRALLDRLHARSEEQDAAIDRYYADGANRPTGFEDEGSPGRAFWLDKFVALERDKAVFVYALARAGGVHRIVEAGTSFGVSTLYLAAAMRDNGGGTVTSCDIEPSKAAVASEYLVEAGLRELVDLRVGDVRSTLRDLDEPIDLLLLDIWAPIAGHVIELVGPKLRPGGIVVADNTAARRSLYDGLFAVLEDPASGFTTQTLPFDGGLELAVKTGLGAADPRRA
ncbi:MAG: class I SAM-dependent methyltransferase [Ilumatobacter sp.]